MSDSCHPPGLTLLLQLPQHPSPTNASFLLERIHAIMAKNSSILQLPYFLINKNSYRRKIRDIVLDALDSKLAVSPKRYISEEKQLSKRVPVVTKSHPEFCPEL